MEKYLDMEIKKVITEFPRVGTILNEYGIGCVTCSVGTCLLKDIISIHNVPKNIEVQLMKKMEAALNNQDVPDEIPAPFAGIQAVKEITYSVPIQKLVDEHKLIKEFLALVPELCEAIEKDVQGSKDIIIRSVDFIRQYADKFHHSKEEDILFAYAKGNEDIVNVMLEDHKRGRYYAKSILLGLEDGDASFISYSLKHYRELLMEHIKKEDEILYPWIERSMSTSDIDQLEVEFAKAEVSFEKGFTEKWHAFVNGLKH
ncbi:MAG: hemerythrin domain-containing protein [Pseudomonadota bacterium]